MNYKGSYRHLLRNSKAAMLTAVEVYNKPRIDYRDECFVILLMNAWELLLKAILSKQGKSIYYAKKRNEPYRTLSCRDALVRAEPFFPQDFPALPVRKNLELLATYRDNAVHFYNKPYFGSVIYALAQTSIINYRDLVDAVFGLDLATGISWQVLPLGINTPIDPIEYISSGNGKAAQEGKAVCQFLSELAAATKEVADAGIDTARLLTVFSVKLESVKKIERADVVVGVQQADGASGPLAILRIMDPNTTHPLRQKDIVEKIGSLHGRPFTSHSFQSLAWKYQWKSKPQYCWQAREGVLTRYSHDVVAHIKRLSKAEVEAALAGYRNYRRTTASGGKSSGGKG